jgi:sugar phosphate isomerase/epimerase
LTNTEETLDFVKQVNHKNIKIHLDLGTIIYNKENIDIISAAYGYFTHFHVSEPGLDIIQERELHKDIKESLNLYSGFISIEMKTTPIENIEKSLKYIASVFL